MAALMPGIFAASSCAVTKSSRVMGTSAPESVAASMPPSVPVAGAASLLPQPASASARARAVQTTSARFTKRSVAQLLRRVVDEEADRHDDDADGHRPVHHADERRIPPAPRRL